MNHMKRSLAQPKISTKTIPIIYMYIKFVIDAYNRYNRCIWLVYLLAWIRPRSSSFPQLFERPENLRLIFTTTICAFQAFFVFHFCGLNSRTSGYVTRLRCWLSSYPNSPSIAPVWGPRVVLCCGACPGARTPYSPYW